MISVYDPLDDVLRIIYVPAREGLTAQRLFSISPLPTVRLMVLYAVQSSCHGGWRTLQHGDTGRPVSWSRVQVPNAQLGPSRSISACCIITKL